MRIVVTSRSTLGHHLGGMETYVENQIVQLLSLGHDVVLLTSPGLAPEYVTRLSSVGVRIAYVEGNSPLRYSAAWHTQIQRSIDALEADLAIFHGVAGSSYVPTRRTAAVTLTHGSAPLSLYNASLGSRPVRSVLSRTWSFMRYAEPLRLRRHQLVALSDFDARLTALSTFQSRSKIRVIPPPLPRQTSETKRKKVVVFAGRIESIKGIEMVLHAWSQIDSNGHRLVVAGSGSLLNRLRNEFGKSDQVIFAGALTQRELAGLLGSARWFVSGGRVMESFGLAAAESLAAGTPVIFPRWGALPQTIGVAGIGYRGFRQLRTALDTAVNVGDDAWARLHSHASIRSVDFSSERSLNMWNELLSDISRHKADRHGL